MANGEFGAVKRKIDISTQVGDDKEYERKVFFFPFASRTMRFCTIYCFRDFYADYYGRIGTKGCFTKLNEVKEIISAEGYGAVI